MKVESRNIDLAQYDHHSQTHSNPRGGSHTTYFYDSHYYVYGSVEGLEGKLKAEAKPVKKGFFNREIVDYKWGGEELAQRLNADSELKSMLLREGLGEIRIDHIQKLPSVGIHGENTKEKVFPRKEAFEVYDRIAQHIRGTVGSKP